MPGVVLVTWARLDFDSNPLTFDHAPFFSKKTAQTGQKLYFS